MRSRSSNKISLSLSLGLFWARLCFPSCLCCSPRLPEPEPGAGAEWNGASDELIRTREATERETLQREKGIKSGWSRGSEPRMRREVFHYKEGGQAVVMWRRKETIFENILCFWFGERSQPWSRRAGLQWCTATLPCVYHHRLAVRSYNVIQRC